jgi:hypothetical protein
LGALLLGALLWLPLNAAGRWVPFLGEEHAIRRTIEDKRDAFELILQEALGSTILLSVTLKNGKVYVGYVLTLFNPAYAVSSIRLGLVRSGHRDAQTLNLTFDIDYRQTHEVNDV